MMNKIFLYVFLMKSLFTFSQSFEGQLHYNVAFEMSDNLKTIGLSQELFIKKMREEGVFINKTSVSYKKGDYKIELIDEENIKSQIYSNRENKVFYFDEDLIVATDASIDIETSRGKPPVVSKLERVENVNGRDCNIVKVQWLSGTYYYFYDESYLKINPEFYKGHNLDMLYQYLKIAKSLPVKIIKETKGVMTVSLVLDTYEKKEIDSRIFDLPQMELDFELSQYAKPNEKVYTLKK